MHSNETDVKQSDTSLYNKQCQSLSCKIKPYKLICSPIAFPNSVPQSPIVEPSQVKCVCDCPGAEDFCRYPTHTHTHTSLYSSVDSYLGNPLCIIQIILYKVVSVPLFKVPESLGCQATNCGRS